MFRRSILGATWVAALSASLSAPLGCGVPAENRRPLKALDLANMDYRLPSDAGAFAPALTALDGDAESLDVLADVERCEECHSDVVAQWRESPHARSSFDNPWYRATVARYRDEVGFTESRFCAACHDPLLLLSGRIDQPVEPTDPWASVGITCGVCHGAVEARVDGRGSYTVSTAPIPLPVRGDAASLERHRARVATPVLRDPALCGSCHRAFLDSATGNAHFLPGMDDLGAWRASAYAGSQAGLIEPQEPPTQEDCRSCHLPSVETQREGPFARIGRTRSHRMAGGQTALAKQTGGGQLDATEQTLVGAASIDVAVATVLARDGSIAQHFPADVASVTSGDRVLLDVVIRNQEVGHRFPGGVRDTQDTWIELKVTDADGVDVAEAGNLHQSSFDETAYRLFTGFADDSGALEERHLVHRFQAGVIERTLAPRDAAVVRYEFDVDRDFVSPLRVQVRLRHRRHSREFAAFVCEALQPGSRFAPAPSRSPIESCSAQPITEIASATVFLGSRQPRSGGSERPQWLRLYEHALGLSHEVQEHVGDAMGSLDVALPLAPTPRARAAILALRSVIEGRQGRVEEAVRDADEAARLLGSEHPALDRAKGRAYARVWRWPEAAAAFRRVVSHAPGDLASHRDLAQSLGSFAPPQAALVASAAGLDLLPRESQLLRSQAFALERLDRASAEQARAAYLAHREPDVQAALRLRCALRVPGCDQAQVPVPTIRMRLVE